MVPTEAGDVTITVAATIKNCRRSTIHKALSEGRLHGRVASTGKARSIWLISRSDLDAWRPLSTAERTSKAGKARHAKGPATDDGAGS